MYFGRRDDIAETRKSGGTENDSAFPFLRNFLVAAFDCGVTAPLA